MILTINNTLDIFKNYLYSEQKSESTAMSYARDITYFNNFLKTNLKNKIRSVDKITKVEITEYKLFLQDQVKNNKIKASTALRRFNSLKVYFKFLEEYYNLNNILKNDKWGNKNNINKLALNENNNFPNVLEIDDINELLNCILESHDKNKFRDLAIFELLIGTGCRRSEVLNLKWEHIDFYKGTIKIIRNKTKNVSLLKMSDSLKNALEIYYNTQEEKSGYVFKSRQSNKLSKSAFNDIINKWIKKSGIEKDKNFKITAHTFRHTFITLCLRNNIPTEKIIEFTGHHDASSLKFYKHLLFEDLSDVTNLIDTIRNKNNILLKEAI